MKSSKPNVLIQFMATLFGGAIFSYVAICTILLNFGFDDPDYVVWIILAAAIIGISLTEILTRKIGHNFHLINLGLFFLMSIFSLLYIGLEDWQFILGLAGSSLIYSAVPAIVYTIARRGQKQRREKHLDTR